MCLAIPGRLLNIVDDDPLTRQGRVDFGGVVKAVNLAYVPEVAVGDYVLIHAGFAITILDEKAARDTLEYLSELGPESQP